MLSLDLGSNIFPTVSFEVGPAFQNVDDSSTLERTVACVEIQVVARTIFVEKDISLGGIAAFHDACVSTQDESCLEWHNQCFMWIPCYGVDLADVSQFWLQFRTHHEGSSMSSIQMTPHSILFTNRSKLIHWVNGSSN